MPSIKIEVRRKSDNKLVYGNEGDKEKFESKFDSDVSRYSPTDYDIVKTDVTSEREKSSQDRQEMKSALDRIKSLDLSQALPDETLLDVVKVLRGRL